jgi:pteridine reductase
MDLNNKVIILTGVARIGVDVAKAISASGAKTAVSYFSKEPEIGDLKVKADLINPDDVRNFVTQVKKQFGQIDGLVHMAANYERTPWAQINDQTMQQSMWPILKSAVLMSKFVGDELLANQKGGKIILFSDWSVTRNPYKDYLPYNVAKSGVEGLTKSLAKELAPKITVNAIAPGPILKPADLSDEEDSEAMKNTPLEKWGGAHEITKAVLYLLDTDFVTGQILYVDGGRSIA